MTISEYQREMVSDVHSWYNDVYLTLDNFVPENIRYMALWAVFNALYNIADYPKVKLRSVSVVEGKVKPYIRGRSEDDKLRFISRQLAQDKQIVTIVMQNHREFIDYLAQRFPQVRQPPDTTVIKFEYDSQPYMLDLSNLHGIASIDNRIFLENDSVLFQYHHLDLVLDKENLPADRANFFRQIVFMLYQLRNNIVHGGSAAYDMQKKDISSGALQLLDNIVRHLLESPELLEQDGA